MKKLNYSQLIGIMEQHVATLKTLQPIMEKFDSRFLTVQPRYSTASPDKLSVNLVFNIPYKRVNSLMTTDDWNSTTDTNFVSTETYSKLPNDRTVVINVLLTVKNGVPKIKASKDIWIPIYGIKDARGGNYCKWANENSVIGIFNSTFGRKNKATKKSSVRRVTTDIEFVATYINQWIETIYMDNVVEARKLKYAMTTEKLLSVM